ncbi:MAG: bifunctional adenosylcobinamide kinase/adenosylcobinamide-phosphate guanylyltransferase [Rhodospirillaceae bacterium]|nr:bifunctional adenosylcobinamide kinase/adenosylcobinamide-phosphate guanylyltransferase [Rhodospirillaceae bacterium]
MNETHLCLVLGGARSGKSRHAEALVEALPAPWRYIATAQAFDEEIKARIRHHQARRGTGWETVEAPLDLVQALEESGDLPVLIDCLTLWLTNLLLNKTPIDPATDRLMAALKARRGTTVLVSNEVGLGIVPENVLARDFRDAAGILHHRLAAHAHAVHFMVAGIPMIVKKST